MNIQEAKETIEKALRAYFARDEIGFPLVPLRQQRPILLIGPPGIGKTAIMEQIDHRLRPLFTRRDAISITTEIHLTEIRIKGLRL